MKADKKIERIKGILAILKIDDHHTSKKQLQLALKEIDEICSEPEVKECLLDAKS